MSTLDKYQEYNQTLEKHLIEIKKKKNYNELVTELNSLYTFLKVISLDYYKDKIMYKYYRQITKVESVLDTITEYFITESSPIFNYQKERPKLEHLNTKNNKEILEWLVKEARSRFIETEYHLIRPKNREIFFKNYSMLNECGDISDIVKLICLENGIECKTLCIYPGFCEEANLYNGYRFHYFNIIKIINKEYIVDLSYRQFFLLSFNLLNRIGALGLNNSLPGSFMTLTSDRLEVSKQLLKHGFIELNNITGKCYFDGFTLSFRNVHFYEQTQDFSYTTIYSLEDYIKFLNKEDSQINHESINTLKLQKTPLKDPYMDLSYRKI